MSNTSKLVRMRIVNLGCIGSDGLIVELDNIVCLVGSNNSGKSTVLRAYESAVNLASLSPNDLHSGAKGRPTSVELWVHIPEGTENIDEKWKEQEGDLLLVRSKWEWQAEGGKPVRTTWNPEAGQYSEDQKASGLDNVFKSRLPKPFRIGSLENPEEEHKRLLALLLEPIQNRFDALMKDENSDLRARIKDLQAEAEKPVADFKEDLEKVRKRVNASYQRVFQSSEIHLAISLGELGIDPATALSKSSYVGIVDGDSQCSWKQQGTGSQRALFWSMLEVRSELTRIEEEKKKTTKLIEEKKKEFKSQEKKLEKAKATKRDEILALLSNLQEEIKLFESSGAELRETASFLPGYMLLIDEPETALHPSAIRAAKEHLYSLASASGWQVMLSTHNPVFVDPLKDHTTIVRLHRDLGRTAPNVYRADSVAFEGTEKENLKGLLAFDPTVAEMFFGSRVVVMEGDTEFAAFTEVMNAHPTDFPIDGRPLLLRARGKATIQVLLKMLTHFKVDFAVLHDIDSPRTSSGDRANSAYTVNESIKTAVASARAAGLKVVHRCSRPNFEQNHGMSLPDKDKPFETWRAVRENQNVKASVRKILNELCAFPDAESANHADDGAHYERMLKDWVAVNDIREAAYTFVI